MEVLEGVTWTKQRFQDWFQRVCRENNSLSFGPIGKGFVRVIYLQSSAGGGFFRNPGKVADISKDTFKGLDSPRNRVGGLPVIVKCPQIKGKLTNKMGYLITEGIHRQLFSRDKYSSFESFNVTSGRR